MLSELIQRLFSTAIVVIGIVLLVFMLIHLIPGDPVDVMLGESASAADRVALRDALGLNEPIGVQLKTYVTGLLHGDLGQSLHSHRPISDLLRERVPATVELALVALGFTLVFSIPLGILAAIRRNTIWDQGAMTFSLLGVSMPNFWLGPLLILFFSVWLGWLPVSGRGSLASVILPGLTLGASLAAVLSRMVRSSLLEVLGEDFVRTAYAKGLSVSQVVWHHALPNALLPVITVVGLQLGTLLAGAVITETIFAWPGIGSLTIEAIQSRDYPVVQACVLLISLTYVLINMLTDLAYAWIDPRIRLGEE